MSRDYLLTREEHNERYMAAVERLKLGEINVPDFRQLLGCLGYNATEIDAELDLIKQELQDGV